MRGGCSARNGRGAGTVSHPGLPSLHELGFRLLTDVVNEILVNRDAFIAGIQQFSVGIGAMVVIQLDDRTGIAGDLNRRNEVAVACNQNGTVNLVLKREPNKVDLSPDRDHRARSSTIPDHSSPLNTAATYPPVIPYPVNATTVHRDVIPSPPSPALTDPVGAGHPPVATPTHPGAILASSYRAATGDLCLPRPQIAYPGASCSIRRGSRMRTVRNRPAVPDQVFLGNPREEVFRLSPGTGSLMVMAPPWRRLPSQYG